MCSRIISDHRHLDNEEESQDDEVLSNSNEMDCKKRKRGLKPKSKRNRKRPRGGVGVLNINDDEEGEISSFEVQIDVLPLENDQNIEIQDEEMSSEHVNKKSKRRIRVVRPYPFTYATFAKARWTNRSLLDVYCSEFGSYPKSYYEASIQNGKITVSGKKVDCEYKIKGGDELCHVVHRHEPAVAISDETVDDLDEGATIASNSNERIVSSVPSKKYVKIIHEDHNVIVVDKPSTIPVHPCGGYNFNSLFHILTSQDPSLEGSLFNVHRLDRLTSGLTIVAKKTEMAKVLGKCITNRECHKVYLARVKGKFPLNVPTEKHYAHKSLYSSSIVSEATDTSKKLSLPCIINGEWTHDDEEHKKGDPATTFWITGGKGSTTPQDVFNSRIDSAELYQVGLLTCKEMEQSDITWFHLACPCDIVCHKNGVCQAGQGKPAQTAFAVLHYDEKSDSTVLLAKPFTGRTHQIRLHLQYVGHPIANDPNYGGDMFFADEEGLKKCEEAKQKLKELDLLCVNGNTEVAIRPFNALSTDIPATEEEVRNANAHCREDSVSILDYLKKSCVWCSRSRGNEERSVLEFLTRSQGIWLHALQYSFMGPDGQLCYSTQLPKWSGVL